MVIVQEWNFTWPLLSPGAIYISEVVVSFSKYIIYVEFFNTYRF